MKAVYRINALNDEEREAFATMNKSRGLVPTGDTLTVGDENRKTVYVVFKGKPRYGCWVDMKDHFESRTAFDEVMIIRKGDCRKVLVL